MESTKSVHLETGKGPGSDILLPAHANKDAVKVLLERVKNDISVSKRIREESASWLMSTLSSGHQAPSALAPDEGTLNYLRDMLWKSLNNSDLGFEIRDEAAICFWYTKDPRAFRTVLSRLDSSGTSDVPRSFAHRCINEFSLAPRPIENAASVSVQVAALGVLIKAGSESDRGTFQKASNSNAEGIRYAGLLGLEMLDAKLAGVVPNEEQSVEFLVAALANEKEAVRDWAALCLRKHGRNAAPAVSALAKALRAHSGTGSHWRIANYLEVLRATGSAGAEARPVLLEMLVENSRFYRGRLESETHTLRSYVLLTLTEIGISNKALPHILDYLNNGEPEMELSFAIAARAAAVLGKESYEAIPLLERALSPNYYDKWVCFDHYMANADIHSNNTSPRLESIRAMEQIGVNARNSLPLLKYWASRIEGDRFSVAYKNAAQLAIAAIER